MGDVADREAERRALERRAYGRGGGLREDPAAIARLRELEGRTAEPVVREPVPADRSAEAAPAPTPHQPARSIDTGARVVRPGLSASTPVAVAGTAGTGEASEDPDDSRASTGAALRRAARLGGPLARAFFRIPRSVGIALLATVAALALAAAAVTVVQRVQTDPLQPGARQVARLGLDRGFPMPVFFAGGRGTADLHAFAEFRGLRAISIPAARYDPDATGSCLFVYAPDSVTLGSDSFNGQLWQGCSSGRFPATAALPVRGQGVPDAVRDGFPSGASLQFVYDTAHQEVVVFVDR